MSGEWRPRAAAGLAALAIAATFTVALAARAHPGPRGPADGTRSAATDAPASPAASPAGAPRIVVEPTSFDFGAVRPEKTVEKEFVVRNHGRATLVIESLVSSCGCTAALMDSQVVKPGGSTPLRVTLVAPEEPGRLQKSILVKSNDPAQPTLELTISAVVTGPSPKTR